MNYRLIGFYFASHLQSEVSHWAHGVIRPGTWELGAWLQHWALKARRGAAWDGLRAKIEPRNRTAGGMLRAWLK